jgi:RNA-binding protein
LPACQQNARQIAFGVWEKGFYTLPFMLEPLNNSQLRKFKATAQLLEPMLKVGKAGLSDGFLRSVDAALSQHELVKIKFAEFKEQKKELAPLLAEKTSSHLILRVGNVLVLHRPRPVAEAPPPPPTH